MKLWRGFAGVAWALVGGVLALGQAQRRSLPTLFVVGDSTAHHANRRGWADPFAAYFDLAKITVMNRACGCSARTLFDEMRWSKILEDVKSGDYILIQFGHNDAGLPDQPPGRADLPGTGDEAKLFSMPDGNREMVHTFGWYIRRFIEDAKGKGSHPIVLSLTVRNLWPNGKVERGLGEGRFGGWSQAVAAAEGIPFVDATNIIADAYEKMGQERVGPMFAGDGTHTSQAGADLNASLIVAGLKGIGSPLALLLSAKGLAVVVPPSLGNSNSPELSHALLPGTGSPMADNGELAYWMERNRKEVRP
jgi:rhamnogalacturonan acetylesterase